jgi:tetratricopeptide (TPR) repeat protein
MGKSSRRKHTLAKEARTDRSSSEGSEPLATIGSLKKRLVHLILIAALGFLAYSNTFHSPFQFDEKSQIINNPVIKDLKNFTSDRKGFDYNPRRFIGYLSFALNYHFGGAEVIGYHVVNLLIHIANALLVYFFVLLTFMTPSMLQSADSSPPSPFLIALFSALLFVSHPLQTQAVTYVIQRFASLATFFYLLSLVMYIKGRLAMEKQDDTEGRLFSGPFLLFYIVSLISAVCAMKTKEIAFTLPLVILLYEFIFFKSPAKKMLLYLLPVLLTLIIVPLSLLQIDRPLGEILLDVSEKTMVQTQMSRWEYLMTEMRVIVTYIRLIFLPINQNLDYDYPVYHSLFTPSVFLSFLFLLSILCLGGYLLLQGKKTNPSSPASHYRLMGFGILWFFITLSVESSIIPIVDVIFEHRLYLPLAGVFTGITTGVLLAAKRLKTEKIVIPVLVLITLLLSGLTYSRNILWNDEISLWQDVAEKSPNKGRPHNNLGLVYASQGRFDRAIVEFQTALRLNPDYAAHNNLGIAYAAQGQIDRAIAEYQITLRLKPDFIEAHYNLGNAYASQGRFDRAIAEYQITLRLKPDFIEAHYNLGNAYASQGQIDRAIAEYQITLRLKPDFIEAHYNLGIAYTSQGQWDRAIAEYQTALRLKPDFYEARRLLNDVVSRRHR